MRNQVEGQISLFDTDLDIGGTGHWAEKVFGKVGCHNCACNTVGRSYHTGLPCEHWELNTCPVVKQRKPEDNPDRDIDPDDSYWMRSPCAGCHRCMPIDQKNKTYGNVWRPHIQHRYMCEYYKPSTMHTEQCLMYSIQAWDNGIKWCAICEANGCEDCYEQWEKAQEFLETYEEES